MANTTTPALEWIALYEHGGEGEPWMAYVAGHHDLFALAPTAEAEICAAFPCHEGTINGFLEEAGGAALSHYWMKQDGETGCDGQPTFDIAKADEPGAFAVTGVRF
jgi:hypothetical protein